jgi:hypothetical protein
MRKALFLSIALLTVGCPPADDPAETTNALPRVTVELHDGDPLTDGATILLTLSDEDGDMCSVDAEFSFDLGETYETASIIQNTHGTLAEVSCPAAGEQITIVWDLVGDLAGKDPATATLRLSPADAVDPGPPGHLLVELKARAQEIGGGFVEIDAAQSTQWQFQRVGLAHVVPTTEGADVSTDYLHGDDDFDTNSLTWSYDLPTPPPEEHFGALLDPVTPGLAAFYLPFAWRETDASGAFDDGEEFAGISDQLLVAYLRPDGDWAHEDWYVVAVDEFGPSEGRYTWLPIDSPIDLNLKGYAVDSATLELQFDNASEVSTARMFGIMPPAGGVDLAEGQPHMTSTTFNPYVPTVTIDVTEEQAIPLLVEGEWGAFAKSYVPLVMYLYLDADDDGEPGEGDQLTHVTVQWSDHGWMFLTYLDAAMSWDRLYDWSIDDCWPGFNLVTPTTPETDIYDGWVCHSVDDPPQAGFNAL